MAITLKDQAKYGVVAVGNAIVDILAHAKDDFLIENEIAKGAMSLIDEARAAYLYDQMGSAIEASGGSAANTLAGYGSFGGQGGFIGKVADDQLGKIFAHDIKAQGIAFDTAPLLDGLATACCYIFVTDDAERSMNTFLGASTEFSEEDVDQAMISDAKIVYLEGYLFDKEKAKNAFRLAASYAREAGAKTALTLSDTFCVERHRDEFLKLIEKDVDILFANQDEAKALYQTDDLDEAVEKLKGKCEVTVVTCGSKGCIILSGQERIDIPAVWVDDLIDTTGAGDQFAAGFLYGLTAGEDLAECGRLGAAAAAEVISHMGPRPEKPYKELIKDAA